MKRIAAWIAALLVGSSALAQGKTPVFLEISPEGELSKQFAFEVKEAFRGSTKLGLVDDPESSGYQLRLTMLDVENDAVIYSWVRTAASEPGLNYYISSTVGICGRSRLVSCSRKFLAELTEEVERDGKAFAEAFLRAVKERDQKKKAAKESVPKP